MAATIGRVLLMPKGNYSGTTAYNALDWVRYNGTAWVCTTDNTIGVIPAVGVPEWQVLAQDGAVTGSVDWSNVNFKPFDDIKSGGGLTVDGSNYLELDTSYLTGSNISYDNTVSGLSAADVQAAIDEIAGSSTDVSWNQIQGSTGATKIAEITIDGNTTDVYSPSGGGGGSSTLAGLTDVTIVSPSDDEVLTFLSGSWVNKPVGSGSLAITQNGTNAYTGGTSFNANSSSAASANIVTDEWAASPTVVASGTFSFTVDNSTPHAYEPYFDITSSSTNKNPSCQISSINDTTPSATIISYTTDADNGTTVKLRIIK